MTIERPMFPPRAESVDSFSHRPGIGQPESQTLISDSAKAVEDLDLPSNVIRFDFGVSRKAYARKARAIKVNAEPAQPAAPSSITAGNSRLRKERQEVWRMAEAATRYWRVRLDFEDAVSWAQRLGVSEGDSHPAVDPDSRMPMADRYRKALVEQLLTPAWDIASVTWKRAVLARNDYVIGPYVKAERVEKAVADDLAWLAAHPTRRSNSEAMARSRDFKAAMRRRVMEVAISRGLSDEEIKPVLKLKHQEIAKFTEKHGVNLRWLLKGEGRVFNSGASQ
jgi:hypothetical protein